VGNKFIVYRVAAKETWYSIARQYKVAYNDLRSANNDKSDTLKVGEEILIPEGVTDESGVNTIKGEPKNTKVISKPVYYTTKKKETLYSIAKQFSTHTDSLKRWNNISVRQLKAGKKIIVGYKLIPVKENPPVKVVEPLMGDSSVAKLKKAMLTITSSKDSSAKKTSVPAKAKHAMKEQGVAAWIGEDEIATNQYFALHRKAPVGTIMKVTNKMNKRYVFVKVVGALPDTGDNNDLVIKISKSSAEKLGVRDRRFQCELDYSVTE
jgi:LysM repeat protein